MNETWRASPVLGVRHVRQAADDSRTGEALQGVESAWNPGWPGTPLCMEGTP